MNGRGRSLLRRLAQALPFFEGDSAPARMLMRDLGGQLLLIRSDAVLEPKMAVSMAALSEKPEAPRGPAYTLGDDGIAEIVVRGVLAREPGLLRVLGCSDDLTLDEIAEGFDAAAADPRVQGILGRITSPGGTAAGTPEAAAAVARAAAVKPVHMHAEDDCCSAAYFIGSQGSRLTSNEIAQVGSIGTVAQLHDTSRRADMQGLRVHVVATGDYKGMGWPGTHVTDRQIADTQRRINEINEPFKDAVARGRRMPPERVDAIADGRIYTGKHAHALGLTDGVCSYAEARASLREAIANQQTTPPPPAPGDQPTPPPATPAAGEEANMAEPKAGAPAGTGQPDDEGFWNQLKQKLGIGASAAAAPAAGAAASAAAAPPAGLTAEEVDARVAAGVKAGLAEGMVAADLAKLEGKVTPAQISAARPLLVKAKAAGDEDGYKAIYGLLAGADASALLGGPVASAEVAGQGVTGLSVNAQDLAWMEANGIKPENVAAIEGKYGRLNRAARAN